MRYARAVVVWALASAASSLAAQTLPDDVSSLPWVVDGGAVDAAVQVDSRLYLGGSFQSIARRSDVIGPVAVFDAQSAQLMLADPALAGAQVNAVVGDGVGGWFVGGLFVVNGQRRQLLRYDAAGQRTPWSLDVGGAFSEIYTLARDGTTLYLGGNFTSLGSLTRTFAAAIDIAGETPLSWSPAITGFQVSEIVVDADDVFLGGFFTEVGGVARNGLAVVHRTSAVVGAFAPIISGSVDALVVTPTMVFAGGGFQTPVENLAAFDRATGGLAMLLPAPRGGEFQVTALAFIGTTLYVGGGFSMVGGQPRHGVAAIDVTTGGVLPWAPTAAGSVVFALAATPEGIYIGGVIDGPRPRHAVRVHPITGVVDLRWDPAPGSLVLAFAVDGARVATAGMFWTYRSVRARGLVGVDLAADRLITLPGITPRIAFVYAMALRGNTLLVGGAFSTLGGQPRTSLGAVDLSTGTVTSFAPVITAPDFSTIGALSLSGSDLYVGGHFASINGVSRPSLARIDADSGAVSTAFSAPLFSGVNYRGFTGLAVAQGRVWAAGEFTAVGGASRAGFAAFDAGTGALDPLDLQANATVENISLSGARLFVGGSFTTLQGQPRAGLASVNVVTRTLEFWTPQAFLGAGRVAANGGAVFSSGFSTQHPSFGITALDASTGVELPWNPVQAPRPDVLIETGAGLLASTYVPGDGRPLYFVRRAPGGAPDAVADVGVLVQGTRVTIRWTPAATGALPTGYTLRVGSQPGASDTAVVSMPRYAGTGVVADVPAGRYFLRIVPSAGGVDGPASQEFAFSTGASGCATVPVAPSLSVAGVPPVLQWTPPAGSTPTGYDLRVGLAPGTLDALRLALPESTTAFATAGAPPGTYYVAVASVNGCGVSVLSNEVAVFVPAPGAPTPPTNLSAHVSGATVTLSWTPPASSVTGYVLEVGSATGLANLVAGLSLGAAPSLVAPNVPAGTYYVRVRAVNGALISAFSGDVIVNVP